jgi:PDZ domain
VRSLFVILLVSLATLACLAQDKPLVEISGSYQYDHLRLSADGASASLNLSRGFDGSVNVPVLPWFDVVGDVSRVWKAESYSELGLSCDSYTGCVDGNATVSILTFGAGPQLTYRRNPYAQPFARFILGDAHSSAGVSLSGIGASASTDSFLITSGGGIDIRLIHNLWFRVGADWLHSSKNGVTVNGVRALGGFKYTFGRSRLISTLPARPSNPGTTAATMRIGMIGIMASVGQQPGAEIAEIFPNGVAALAALHRGDVIDAVDDRPIKSPMELAVELSSRKAGDQVRLGYLLHGQWQSETVVILGENH